MSASKDNQNGRKNVNDSVNKPTARVTDLSKSLDKPSARLTQNPRPPKK